MNHLGNVISVYPAVFAIDILHHFPKGIAILFVKASLSACPYMGLTIANTSVQFKRELMINSTPIAYPMKQEILLYVIVKVSNTRKIFLPPVSRWWKQLLHLFFRCCNSSLSSRSHLTVTRVWPPRVQVKSVRSHVPFSISSTAVPARVSSSTTV